MKNRQLLFFVVAAIAAVLPSGGCGETNDDRRQISQHAKNLAATVKSKPNSVEGQEAMQELIDLVNGNWSFARSQACYAMVDLELGALATPAVPDLIRAAKSGDPFVEQAAVCALASIGPSAAPAVDLLIAKIELALSKHDYSVLLTLDATKALGNIGEPALKAIPVLERASGSGKKFFAEEAQKALDKLKQLENTETQNVQTSEE